MAILCAAACSKILSSLSESLLASKSKVSKLSRADLSSFALFLKRRNQSRAEDFSLKCKSSFLKYCYSSTYCFFLFLEEH